MSRYALRAGERVFFGATCFAGQCDHWGGPSASAASRPFARASQAYHHHHHCTSAAMVRGTGSRSTCHKPSSKHVRHDGIHESEQSEQVSSVQMFNV
jgi:hypothetical protein